MQKTFEPKKYFIETLGCQANIADSSTIAGILEALGFEKANNIRESDLFIINTCSVRQKSEDKVYGMGRLFKGPGKKIAKKDKPFIIMAGCMVGSVTGTRQRASFEELKNKTPWVDEYINPTQIIEIPNILKRANLLDEWAQQKLKTFDIASVESRQKGKKHVFINVSYGCDNFCTFCVVPYARGKEVSRTKEAILKEINHLIKRGFTQITLCGQNVNSWGLSKSEKFKIRTGSNQKLPFASLLRELCQIKELEKIDFISSNPFDFTQDLIEAIKSPKISDYIHIAVQSGNNEVLEKMHRRHTIEEFYDLIRRIKKAKPSVRLGTDIIVGFPGETKEQFEDTVELFKKIQFEVAFISIYSTRQGTYAQKNLDDNVSLKEKKRRHTYLTKVWNETKSK